MKHSERNGWKSDWTMRTIREKCAGVSMASFVEGTDLLCIGWHSSRHNDLYPPPLITPKRVSTAMHLMVSTAPPEWIQSHYNQYFPYCSSLSLSPDIVFIIHTLSTPFSLDIAISSPQSPFSRPEPILQLHNPSRSGCCRPS